MRNGDSESLYHKLAFKRGRESGSGLNRYVFDCLWIRSQGHIGDTRPRHHDSSMRLLLLRDQVEKQRRPSGSNSSLANKNYTKVDLDQFQTAAPYYPQQWLTTERR
jgi:hypothetical protein